MRQALNNLQSTKEGFGLVNSENVFKVILPFIYWWKSFAIFSTFVILKNGIPLVTCYLNIISDSFRFATNLTRSWCATCLTTVSLATSTRRTRRWTTSGSWATPLKTSSPTSSGSARITTRWRSTPSSSSSRRSASVTWESSKAVAPSSRWQHSLPECVKLLKSRNVKPQTNILRIYATKSLIQSFVTVKINFNDFFLHTSNFIFP